MMNSHKFLLALAISLASVSAWAQGRFMQFTPDMGSFAYAWYSDSEVILVLANGDEVLRTWPVERFAELGLKPGTPVSDLLIGGGFNAEASLDFGAKGIRVLKFSR